MNQAARTIGIPGAGKTTRAIDVTTKIQARGLSIFQVGFCSFTRAARREASERAAQEFGVTVEELERQGWFRTIHSACLKLLKVPRGSIVNYDPDWLAAAVHDPALSARNDADDDEAWTNQWKGKSPTAVALQLWDLARNRLCSYRDVFHDMIRRLSYVGGLDSAEDGEAVVELYERAKARDGRLDFCDVILRYAGYRMTVDGPEKVEPEGTLPGCIAWIFDEAQDTSAALDQAARRLASESRWVYLMGDSDQCIYEWAGANGQLFLNWPVVHEEHLLKTYRCAQEIIGLGMRLLHPEGGIHELAVEPRCPGGEVVVGHEAELLDHVNGQKKTLVLARTNQGATVLGARLSERGIPWKSARGSQRWPGLASTRTCQAFAEFDSLGSVPLSSWRRIVGALDVRWLKRGTKARYEKALPEGEREGRVSLDRLEDYGGTVGLRDMIAGGCWPQLVQADEVRAWAARQKWGDLVDTPAVTVSTVHGSKGLEADTVILHTGIAGPVLQNLKTEEGREEERRVWYVGATRARDRLVLLKGRGNNYKELLDAL